MRVHYLFKLVFLFPLDKYPELELLDDMVALVSIFFFFLGTSILFFKMTASIYHQRYTGFPFPILTNTNFLSF